MMDIQIGSNGATVQVKEPMVPGIDQYLIPIISMWYPIAALVIQYFIIEEMEMVLKSGPADGIIEMQIIMEKMMLYPEIIIGRLQRYLKILIEMVFLMKGSIYLN